MFLDKLNHSKRRLLQIMVLIIFQNIWPKSWYVSLHILPKVMGEFSIGRVDVSSCASTPAEPTDLAEVAEDERSRLLLRDKAGNSWPSLPSFFIAAFLLCSLRRQVSLLRQPSSLLSRPDFFLAKRRRSLGTTASFVDLLRLAAVFLCKKVNTVH